MHFLFFCQMALVIGQGTGRFVSKERIVIVLHNAEQHFDHVVLVTNMAECILHSYAQMTVLGVDVSHEHRFRL